MITRLLMITGFAPGRIAGEAARRDGRGFPVRRGASRGRVAWAYAGRGGPFPVPEGETPPPDVPRAGAGFRRASVIAWGVRASRRAVAGFGGAGGAVGPRRRSGGRGGRSRRCGAGAAFRT